MKTYKQWGVQSSDGNFYRVGKYANGEWHPGSFLLALKEWVLLREFGSYVRYQRKAGDA